MGDRLKVAWDAGPDATLFLKVAFLYTVESFMYAAINMALRT